MSDEQDADAIALLLDANGLSSSAAAAASTIDTIELFMASYPTMRGLHAFPALTTLELIACGITAIAGLGRLTSLRRLALCENRIARLEGLDVNVNLVSLDLRANTITRVGNVSHLVSLEYLSLADNRVASLAGLNACQSLTTLNVANNAIEQCGSELEGLRALRDLNLSGNRIGCLDDVRFLGRALPSLRNVYLSDPHYGDNPVCALCNYQTFALYHLAQVDILDGTLISAQARANAQSVYVKKVMYYNMRIKIAKKQATDAIRQADQVRLGYLAHINVAMSVVWRQKRDLDQVRHQRALAANRPTRAADPNDPPVSDAALREKCAALDAALHGQLSQSALVDADLSLLKQRVQSEASLYVSRLQLELETGGNVRVEQGAGAADQWYASCVALVAERAHADAFAAEFAVDRVDVTGVARVYNRHLRTRFDAAVEKVDGDRLQARHGVFYVFVGIDGADYDTYQKRCMDMCKFGMERAVADDTFLTNSLAIADRTRLTARASDPQFRHRRVIDRCAALLCKAYHPVGPDGLPALVAAGDDPAGQYRLDRILNASLVLPEYVVDYRYLRTDAGDAPRVLSFTEAVDDDDDDAQASPVPHGATTPSHPGRNVAIDRDVDQFRTRWSREHAETCDTAEWRAVLAMPPVVTPRDDKVSVVTMGTIREQARAIGLDDDDDDDGRLCRSLPYLNLHGHALTTCAGLVGRLAGLHTLILAFNQIESMAGLSALVHLTHLDLGHNLLQRIEGLAGLARLTVCHLNNNALARLDDLELFALHCPNLVELNLSQNPMCSAKTYAWALRACVPKQIQQIDMRPVQALDDAASAAAPAVWNGNASVLDVGLLRACAMGPDGAVLSAPAYDATWAEHAVGIQADHQRLRSIASLSDHALPNLKSVSFCDNDLRVIEGFGGAPALEVVALEDNHIATIGNLSTLPRLQRLELGNNRISEITGLDQATSLLQLSLEDNAITSLSGLEHCTSLLELYLSNNRVEALSPTIKQLRLLVQLVILDLSGNPVCREPSYRLACVFNVKKLKVLDGVPVTGAEIDGSRDEFEGRITEEFLDEWIHGRSNTSLDDLDLSGFQIRSIDPLSGHKFLSVRQVNLENNALVRVESLAALSSMTSLNLSHNRVDAIADGAWAPLVHLEHLYLASNRVTSIASLHLECLPRLRTLNLKSNDIRVVAGLQACCHVRELNLCNNQIRAIGDDDLRGLLSLRHLTLDDNAIKALSALCQQAPTYCPRLQILSCAGNRIATLSDLDQLQRIAFLLDVTLQGNPVARKQMYRPTLIRSITTLKCIDGRDVTAVDRARIHSMFAMVEGAAAVYAPLAGVFQAPGGAEPDEPPAVVAAHDALPSPGGTRWTTPQSEGAGMLRNVFSVKGFSPSIRRSADAVNTSPPVQVQQHQLMRSPRAPLLLSPKAMARARQQPAHRRPQPATSLVRGGNIRALLAQAGGGGARHPSNPTSK